MKSRWSSTHAFARTCVLDFMLHARDFALLLLLHTIYPRYFIRDTPGTSRLSISMRTRRGTSHT